ncbi:MAG TPA: right-handed parallel beta-helix repeat-containing protein [Solirubrobacterales bacterium]
MRIAPAIAAAIVVLGLPALAAAHIERPAYWPDPKPDRQVHPAAGGRVPTARTLSSALNQSLPGKTRIVCQSNSLQRARSSIHAAETTGYRLRPTTQPHRLSKAAADHLLALNQTFARRCVYHSIQRAVSAAHNNDFIVVMPGTYIEGHSRKQPTNDPRCQRYLTDTDFGGGGPIGLSYRYQWNCPNDQALVNVLGRRPAAGAPPPPRADRHGIPDLGPCVRCNLQLQGSGAKPEDVVIDSGKVAAGNGGPSGVGSKKDVALKVDRADGFVLKNMTMRHAKEHDLYVLETDGYLLDRVKFFYAGEYGQLTFADDHGLTQNCEGVGNGDSAVYPGGAPDTGDDTAPNAPDPRDTSFYPQPRLNQKITHCDLHHNNLGYSGTMGNATHVVGNNFYDNTTGIATDSFFAGGHPGFPQNSSVFERNRIYSNNFNDYHYPQGYPESRKVESAVGVPLGTGIIIAGGNDDVVRGNRIYDNWRRGTMLLAVPDALSCPPGSDSCTPSNASSTSYDNSFHGNTMGLAPGGQVKRNGVDFWWDEFPGDTGNCWFANAGPDGTNASWTGDPQRFPQHNMSVPHFLPEDCATSAGTGNPDKEAVLAYCSNAAIGDESCEWYTAPPRPGTAAAARYRQAQKSQARRIVAADRLSGPSCQLISSTISCAGYANRP